VPGLTAAARRSGHWRGVVADGDDRPPVSASARAWKWVDRFRREGVAGLEHRPSVPRRVRACARGLILLLRALRFTSREITETRSMPLSTVGAVLSRNAHGKLPRRAPQEPAHSHTRPRPGGFLHICRPTRTPPPTEHAHPTRLSYPRPNRRLPVHAALHRATRDGNPANLPGEALGQSIRSGMAWLGIRHRGSRETPPSRKPGSADAIPRRSAGGETFDEEDI
jgi:hypothetical protein